MPGIDVWVVLGSFAVVALAARRIGDGFARGGFPLITGFLVAGILCGPYVLDLLPRAALAHLRVVDEIALGFIALAAGAELHLEELRNRLRSILSVTLVQVAVTFAAGTGALWLLASRIPFLHGEPAGLIWAAALLTGAILVARSPSSTIAILTEMRAKGPFSQAVLGVTLLSDVVVIALFAANVEIGDFLLSGNAIQLRVLWRVLVQLVTAVSVGYALSILLRGVLRIRLPNLVKSIGVLAGGWGVFALTRWMGSFTYEPLLACMAAGIFVTHDSARRAELHRLLHDLGPAVYVAFFTLTGVALELDLLAASWIPALALVGVRLVAIGAGTFAGCLLAREPARHARVMWMGFVTQAGVGLGLAKEVADTHPGWGEEFATLMVGVIVINQLVGPPLFKWVLHHVGESHTRADPPAPDEIRQALVFGSGGGQSLTLARRLREHGWVVRVVVPESAPRVTDVEVAQLGDITEAGLRDLGAARADAIVALRSDDDNLRLCELAYEKFGTETLVARVEDRTRLEAFRALGVLVVDPSIAIVNLLEHLVLSPVATSILLGDDPEQEVVEVEVRDPELEGVPIRELRLPVDSLVLSVHRHGHTLISHGYTRLRRGDRVTVITTPAQEDRIRVLFEA